MAVESLEGGEGVQRAILVVHMDDSEPFVCSGMMAEHLEAIQEGPWR